MRVIRYSAGPAGPTLGEATEIRLPRAVYASVVGHACRKLDGHYIEGEHPERKAFGLLAGVQRGSAIEVTAVFPLIANLRFDERHREDFDELVDAHAIPSETPAEQRGWVADPREVIAAERACDDADWLLFGNYHTHRVAWPDDPWRDSCTRLDRELAAGTGQWTFILSAVDLNRPILRAYFEGGNDREAAIRVLPVLARAA
jgi:hypothetical protein